MRIRWRGLELPSRLVRDDAVSTETYGRFIIEPFERGFGTTVGNSLRRILLSSLDGAAVYAVKIANAAHEFTTLPGVIEDVAEIILNIKGIVVAMDGEQSRTMRVSRKTAGVVTAGDIVAETGVEVMNPQLKIATLTESVPFDVEMRVRTGRGYATADENMGQRTNYDRLVLEVWTRGSVSPEDAVVEAARILRKHLNPFVQYYELGDDLVSDVAPIRIPSSEVNEELQGKLAKPVSELQLSVRAANCLESARVRTIGELVAKTEADLLRVRSFGKTSLREVKQKLADLGLSLGMTFGGEAKSTSPAGGSMDFASSDDLGEGGDGQQLTPGAGVRAGAAGSNWSMVADSTVNR